MKEHEREADLTYKALKLDDEHKKTDRYSSSRYRDKERERYEPRDSSTYTKERPPKEKREGFLSKEQRRHLFEMKVAQQENERRQQELWYCHEQNCMKFGLNPRHVNPNDVPAMMNPITGQYFTGDRRPLPTPPSHQYMKFDPPPLPTNPAEYELPQMDLPPLWKFAIDNKGRIYYYHVKIRLPQWKPPILLQPLNDQTTDDFDDDDIQLSDDGSESSTTDTCDSEEEELKEKLEILQKCKEKSKTQFNLDDLLAKPSDLNEEDEEKRLGTIPSIEETNNLLGAQVKADILNTASNFKRSLDTILPNLKRIQRKRSGLVQERCISPRTEEDKIRGHLEMRKYKETKEKLRRRKEEAKRKQMMGNVEASTSDVNARPKIVDELDILQSSEVKRPSVYEEWQEQKIRLEKKRQQQQNKDERTHKRKKSEIVDLNSEEARRIKDKFRTEIAGVIVHHLRNYMKDDCQIGKITNNDDFKHLARKLTHFVMLKELKHCDNTIGHLEVTESVKVKAREFIKKYMAKYNPIYVRPDNEPDFKE
uniref:CSON010402 protein n=1 Tax=Culicoides sonorensis TaxID=179676 RepID=A0A336MYX7_CULSO